MTAYKIIDFQDGKARTLFHGINGSKTIPMNEWVKADKKMASDGTRGTRYLTGWHLLPTKEECVEYLQRFTNLEHKAIAVCQVRGDVWKKEHSHHNVLLADEILIQEVIKV